MQKLILFLTICLGGCAPIWIMPDNFVLQDIKTSNFTLRTYQKILDTNAPVHIYIEGDGYAFDAMGTPTQNPTPHGTFMREMAKYDTHLNVAYVARPCQYIMDTNCNTDIWTSGRFSKEAVDSVRDAVKQIANGRPVVLIGYSGGAMISGIIINENPDINVQQWITIAGVLNHKDWTSYFGDTPLYNSKNMNKLPHVSQTHYVAEHDKVVPIELSKKWIKPENMIIVPNATHNRFPDFTIKIHTGIDKRN